MAVQPVSAIDGNTVAVKPVASRQTPCEGPKAIQVICDFSQYAVYTLNGQALVQSSRMCQVESVYIDASGTDAQTIVTTDSGQAIRAPGRTQGWYSVVAGIPFSLSFANGDSNALMSFLLTNVTIPNATWACE